jgi:hypothetical protein
MAKNHEIDYEAFLPRLVAGLRQAWQEVRRLRAKETFYTFGIETDSDITDLQPICNTEEEYRAQGGGAVSPLYKWVGCLDEDSELYRAGSTHTSALAKEVNRYVFENHRGDPPTLFKDRKKRLLALFEKALVQLDDEGFFGTGKKRNQVLLRIEFVDPSKSEWKHTLKVIERINPPKSTAAFFAALKQQQKETAAEDSAKERGQKPIKDRATEFLRSNKRPFDRSLHARQIETVTPFLLGLVGEESAPPEFWEVCFQAKNEPEGRSHGPGVLMVYVLPHSGKCVIPP